MECWSGGAMEQWIDGMMEWGSGGLVGGGEWPGSGRRYFGLPARDPSGQQKGGPTQGRRT